MWRNPKYPAPEEPAAPSPPEDRGQRLATLARGQDEEFRVNLDEYQGRPYVSLRLWQRSQDGNFWPTRKGCSVRIGELPDVIAALQRAEELATQPQSSTRSDRRTNHRT
jgi:hypothetical protein